MTHFLYDLEPSQSSSNQFKLGADEVHVWHLDDTELKSQAILAKLEVSLSEDELSRRNRFKFDKDKHQYLVAHGALRYVLSQYVSDIAPAAWQFTKNDHGRPFIVGEPEASTLFFNISHTKGRVVFAISRKEMVGVDVELENRQTEPALLADRFFSPDESAALLALPEAEHQKRFFRLWTLKEAYIKACGMGLFIPLNHFSYSFPGNDEITIAFDSERTDDPRHWQFWHWELPEARRVSLALKDNARPEINISHRYIGAVGKVSDLQLNPILKSSV